MAEPSGGAGDLRYAVDGAVAVVTVDRPRRSNAIAPETAEALHALVRRTESDATVRAVVISGAGSRVFCAGSDLHAKSGGAAPSVTDWGFAGLVKAPRSKPWVAAVNGAAVGGGFEIVLACDLAIASDTATFSLPEVRRGLVAGGGGLIRLPQRLPTALVNEVLVAGRTITSAEALAWGLVNRRVPAPDVLPAALDLARRCTSGAPIAVRESLAVARRAVGSEDPELWRLSEQASATVAASADGREGPRAFSAKREPRWLGR